MIVNHFNPTEFTIHATAHEHTVGPYPLAPITVVTRTGACDIQTHWTPEQAVAFAAELVAMATKVEAAQAAEVAA